MDLKGFVINQKLFPFVAFSILLQQLQEKKQKTKTKQTNKQTNKQAKKKTSSKKIICALSAKRSTELGLVKDYARKFHQEANGNKLSKHWLAQ